MSDTDSPRSSVCSDESEIPTLEFNSPAQVEELMDLYIEKYNDCFVPSRDLRVQR